MKDELSEYDEDEDSGTELKPCPHCDGPAQFGEVTTEDADDSGGQYVECSKCGACTCLMFPLMEDVKEILAEKWNARAVTEVIPASEVREREEWLNTLVDRLVMRLRVGGVEVAGIEKIDGKWEEIES